MTAASPPASTSASAAALPARLGGLDTLRYLIRFLRDPVGTGVVLQQRYGPFVLFESSKFSPQRGRATAMAVGADFNRAVLGDPRIWHTENLTLRGPKDSALQRLGGNLVSLNGARHAYYRKLLARPVRSTSVEEMGDDIGRLVGDEVATWKRGAADLFALSKDLMRMVAVALLFGGDQKRGAELSQKIERLVVQNMSPQARLCRADMPGTAYRGLMRSADEVERCAIDFAEARRGVQSERDLLSLLVNSPDENGAAPSRELIAGHVPILFASTFETCQTALTWTLFLLAQHPRIARDLTDELSAALGGEAPTLSRVASLPLLDAVVRESMRVLPPVPYQVRQASQSAMLGGQEVRAGTHVVLSPYLTNRAPHIYDAPARFLPERWSRIAPSPFEYIVFSGGPRACPGFWFGTGVVKVAVAAIVSRFRFGVVPGARIDRRIAITMAPRNGIPVVLGPPDGKWAAAPVLGQICEMLDMQPGTLH